MPVASGLAWVEFEAEFGGPKWPIFGDSSILGPGLRKFGILTKKAYHKGSCEIRTQLPFFG